MGIGLFRGSKCSTGDAAPAPDPKFGNPNPKRFKIIRYREYVGPWTVVEVRYPDAKNYEGRKIMVYRCSFKTLAAQAELDPHFCDDGTHPSPFARFEPTDAGWAAAQRACG